jgi:hypothetical protein
VFKDVFAQTGLSKDDIDFWCSGSSDYLAGRAFSFVTAVDAIGSYPPKMESHLEMDAAWALYEAWVKLLTGEADTALVYGFGKSSAGHLRRVLALQLDPYVVAPLWPDSVSIAALQARLGIEAGLWSEKDMAAVAARLSGESVDDLLAYPYVADPLRRHDCAPISDGAAAIVIAGGERARQLCDRPAWITGLEHRVDAQNLGLRDLTTAPSATAAARAALRGSVEVAELHAPFTHQEILLRHALGLGRCRRCEPEWRRACQQYDVRRRAVPHRPRGASRRQRRHPRARPRDERSGVAAKPRVRAGGAMRAAVLGTGADQAHHQTW